ncbi:MAG: class I SAM-dependent methyltransferase [Acidimicrobiales bacterium]
MASDKTKVAGVIAPVVAGFVGHSPTISIRFWDNSSIGPPDSKAAIVVRSPRALRRLLYSPNELGAARAYVAGELDVEGDIFAALGVRDNLSEAEQEAPLALGRRIWPDLVRAVLASKAIGPPLAPPPEEARLKGRRHSKERDAAAISHHYDVSNDFYRLFLGETMTYSCGYFASPGASLEEAQRAKYDLICRKLGLGDGMRLLDVGCGWGGMALYAAENYGVNAVGVTLSTRQAELARERVARAGLSNRVEIRVQDYREVSDGPFDAISSIGMFEHVGLARLNEYLANLYQLLKPGGRLLNHGISRPWGPSGFDRNSFVERYVFPDGELHEVGLVVSAAQGQHLEVRDVESLREHYAKTLRCWVSNLEANWDAAIEIVGPARARIWRLYMAGSALNFEAGRTSIHQILAVRTAPGGSSGIPPTREELLGLTVDKVTSR